MRGNGDETGLETARERADPAMPDLLLMALSALVPFAVIVVTRMGLSDGDIGWHIALGRWILAHGAVPDSDPFSFTAAGQPWTAHEWLAGVLMALMHRLAGWSGVLVLYGAALAALFALVAGYLRRWLPPLAVASVLALVALALLPFAIARPHVLAWPLLAGWIVVLLRAREADRAPPLWAVLVMVLWANVHGSFALGIALIAPLAAEALWAHRRDSLCSTFRGWTIFGVASVLAAMVTPYGPETLLFPFRLVAMPDLANIAEWKATDFSQFGLFQAVLLAGLFLLLVRPVSVPVWRLLVIVGLLHLALAHVRHQAIFAIGSALLLAAPLSVSWGTGEQRGALWPRVREDRGELRKLALLALAAILALAVWRLVIPAMREDSAEVPVSAVAALPADLKDQPGFNEYSFGGTLIAAGFPVFIDGRVDMYGPDILAEYMRAETGDAAAWRATVAQRGIRWAIVKPDSGLVPVLDREPGWQRTYADGSAVVYQRGAVR